MKSRRDWSWVEKDGIGNHWLNVGHLEYQDHLFLREVCKTIEDCWDDLYDLTGLECIELSKEIYDIYAKGLTGYCKEMYFAANDRVKTVMSLLGFLNMTISEHNRQHALKRKRKSNGKF